MQLGRPSVHAAWAVHNGGSIGWSEQRSTLLLKKNKSRIALDLGARMPQMLIRARVAGTHFWPTRPTRASAILSLFCNVISFFFPFSSFFSQLPLFSFFFLFAADYRTRVGAGFKI